ncbi:hypothetical protein LINPERPRIM_LOCUS19334 [Linum perenne]
MCFRGLRKRSRHSLRRRRSIIITTRKHMERAKTSTRPPPSMK